MDVLLEPPDRFSTSQQLFQHVNLAYQEHLSLAWALLGLLLFAPSSFQENIVKQCGGKHFKAMWMKNNEEHISSS